MKDSEFVTGGCFCGAVRYEARAYLHDAYYCHCRICQKTSGAPAEIGVYVEPGTLRYTKGNPAIFQTSPFGERGFCEKCGSRLIWQHVDGKKPEYTNVSLGSLDNSVAVEPTSHQCVESQIPWYRPNDDLPKMTSDEMPELVALWQASGADGNGQKD
jgi:hypothetical protein